LCHDPRLSVSGACRICCVEVDGFRNLVPSCAYPVNDGMVVSNEHISCAKGS
jgi:NADH dehydrogenase/NADH:ubiquinone oxidoreductase subunit G